MQTNRKMFALVVIGTAVIGFQMTMDSGKTEEISGYISAKDLAFNDLFGTEFEATNLATGESMTEDQINALEGDQEVAAFDAKGEFVAMDDDAYGSASDWMKTHGVDLDTEENASLKINIEAFLATAIKNDDDDTVGLKPGFGTDLQAKAKTLPGIDDEAIELTTWTATASADQFPADLIDQAPDMTAATTGLTAAARQQPQADQLG